MSGDEVDGELPPPDELVVGVTALDPAAVVVVALSFLDTLVAVDAVVVVARHALRSLADIPAQASAVLALRAEASPDERGGVLAPGELSPVARADPLAPSEPATAPAAGPEESVPVGVNVTGRCPGWSADRATSAASTRWPESPVPL